jgi:hypothetical protein
MNKYKLAIDVLSVYVDELGMKAYAMALKEHA